MYQWQVRSFNGAGEMNGESPKQKFSVVTPSAFVQDQVIFLVNNDNDGRALIDKMTTKYNLQIKEQIALSALNQIMIICFTEADIEALLKELQAETGVFNVQPNYIFSTLQTPDPLRAMQTIDKILDLDSIHKKLTGKNVLVAIIDTGVDIHHKDLQQSIKEYQNFVSGSEYIGEIHGTGVLPASSLVLKTILAYWELPPTQNCWHCGHAVKKVSQNLPENVYPHQLPRRLMRQSRSMPTLTKSKCWVL